MKACIENMYSRWSGPRTEPAGNEAGFLKNLGQWDLSYRLCGEARDETACVDGDAGLIFHARRSIPAGTALAVKIRAGGEVHRFDGVIVLVKQIPNGFRLGLWLRSADDAVRARRLEALSLAHRPQAASVTQVLSAS